jgi:hypothetical protein
MDTTAPVNRMPSLPEILHRNREGMRRLLASFVIPPWEAEPMLSLVVESFPRSVWERLPDPDHVLLTRVAQACRSFEALRRKGGTANPLIEWESPRGREFAGL